MAKTSRKPQSILGTIVVVILLLAVWWWQEKSGGGGGPVVAPTGNGTVQTPPESGTPRTTAPPKTDPSRTARPAPRTDTNRTATAERDDEQKLLDAYRARRSDIQLMISGVVRRNLPDDNDGSRHQKFILRMPSGHTVLVAHNIDLAPRVPLGEGDRIRLFGEYEWSEQGGVMHWTHHDPGGRHVGGWIEYAGERYE